MTQVFLLAVLYTILDNILPDRAALLFTKPTAVALHLLSSNLWH